MAEPGNYMGAQRVSVFALQHSDGVVRKTRWQQGNDFDLRVITLMASRATDMSDFLNSTASNSTTSKKTLL